MFEEFKKTIIFLLIFTLFFGLAGLVEARDFIIREEGNPSNVLFKVQGSDGYIGIGTGSLSSPFHVQKSNNPLLTFRNSNNGGGVAIDFSDHASGSYVQTGTIEYTHLNTSSFGAGESFWIYGTESSLNLYVDGGVLTTGNVGIGTTSPGYKLDVSGGGSFSNPVIVGTPTGDSHATTKSYVDSAVSGGTGETVGYWTQSGTDIYSSNSGNVGIGTTTPGSKLDVSGTVTANSLSGALSAGNVSSGEFGSNTGGGNYSFPSDLTVGGIILGDISGYRNLVANNVYSSGITGYKYTNGRSLTSGSLNRINFSRESSYTSDYARVLSDGYYSLSFWYKVENYVSGSSIVPDISDQGLSSFDVSSNKGWTFYSDMRYITVSSYGFLDMQGTFDADVTVSDIVIIRSPKPAEQYIPAPEDLVKYNGSGNVGIGTTSPGYKLDVSGGGSFSNPVVVGTPTGDSHAATKSYVDSAAGGGVPTGTTGQTLYNSGGSWLASSNLYHDGTNVGIGTTSPGAKLDIETSTDGDKWFSMKTSDGDSLYWQQDTGGSSADWELWNGAGEIMHIWEHTNDVAVVGKMLAGGLDTPINDLDVKGAVAIGNSYGGNDIAPSSGLIIEGNVGIGTTSPGYALDVSGGGSFSNPVVVGTPTGDSHATTKSYVDSAVSGGTGETVGYWTQSGTDVYNSNSGNVGIGTTTPGSKLDVSGTVTANSLSGALSAGNVSSGEFGSNTGGGNYSFPANVGIGTTSPVEKLDVEGYIKGNTDNLISSHSWTIGTGSVGRFTTNGDVSENSREWGIGPHGQRTILWKAVGDVTSGADGGWDSLYFNIDHTKTYRYSVWIKKSVDRTDGSTYFGTRGQGCYVTSLSDVENSNPYFWSGDLPQLDKWYLLVGYVHGSGDVSTTSYGGIYDGVTGKKVINMNDFKFQTCTTGTGHRSYLYYSVTGNATQYWWDPRVEMVTGQEPTIESLLGLYKGATQNTDSYFEGNVGIGTTSPGYALDVSGGGSFSNPVVVGTPTGDSHATTKSYVDSAAGGGVPTGTTGQTLYNSGGNWLASSNLYHDGTNVGIGTTSPGNKLDVSGTLGVTGAATLNSTLSFTDKGSGSTQLAKMGGNQAGGFYQISDRGGLMITSADDTLILADGDVGRNFGANINPDAEATYVLSDGNVYIKTDLQEGWGTEHSFVFTNSGNLTAPGGGSFTNPVVVGTPTGDSHATTKSYVDSAVSGSGGLWTESGSDIYYNTGNVGVGTTTPSNALDVDGVLAANTLYTDTIGPRGSSETGGVGESAAWSSITVSGDSTFATSEGRVGVGTSNPGYDFQVNTGDSAFIVDSSGTIRVSTTTSDGAINAGGGRVSHVGTPINSSDAATKAYVDSAAGGGLTGSGTSNYITKWTGTEALGNSVIYDNGTNVGIRTMSPEGHQLDIASYEGSTGESAIRALYPNGGGLLNTEFGALANREGQWNAIYSKQGAASAALYTDGEVNLMNGNVGIGDSTPTYKLDVSGTGRFTSPVVVGAPTDDSHAATKSYVDSAASGAADGYIGDAQSHTAGGSLSMGNNAITNINWSGSDDGSGSGLDADLLDGVNSTDFSKIDGSSVSNSANDLAVGWYTVAINTGDRASARFGMRDIAGSRHQSVTFYASHHYGSGNSVTVLHTGKYSTTPYRYIRIKEGGTYDGAMLQVYIDSTTNNLEFYLLGDNFQTSGWILKDFVPDGTDPGGLGNFSALTNVAVQVDLDDFIEGGMYASGNLASGGNLLVSGSGSFGSPVTVGAPTSDSHAATKSYVDSAAGGGLTGSGTSNYITKWTGTEALGNSVIYDNGTNIGIGTTSPGAKLEISGATKLQSAWSSTDITNNSFYAQDSTDGFAMGHGTAVSTWWSWDSSNNLSRMVDVYNDGSKIILGYNGTTNVGIGTTSPGYALDVSGGGSFSSPVVVGAPTADSHAATRSYVDSAVSGSGGLWTESGSDIYYNTGNVGVGTTSPSSPFYVDASAYNGSAMIVDRYSSGGVASIQAGPSNSWLMLEGAGTTGLVGINYYSSGDVIISNGGGNVGIGSTSPSTALDVSGTVTATAFVGDGSGLTGIDALPSGSSGQTLRHDSTGWTANSLLYNNGTNVGIGTTSPGYELEVVGDVAADAYYYRSDIALKENINIIDNALAKVLQLEGVFFNWKDNKEDSIGLIAQEVEKVFPEAVTERNGYKSVDYARLVPPVIEAVKEQQNQIEELKAEIEKLKSEK